MIRLEDIVDYFQKMGCPVQGQKQHLKIDMSPNEEKDRNGTHFIMLQSQTNEHWLADDGQARSHTRVCPLWITIRL